MPVNSAHPSYTHYAPEWVKCRDAYEGQSAIKAKSGAYLPVLTGQTQAEYDAYKQRALFYSITSKSVGALVGMALSKPPDIDSPPKLKGYFEDKSGTEFFELFSNCVAETLLMGRYGVFIDRPRLGGAPFLRTYSTENILNWEYDDEDRLVMVVLRETYLVQNTTDEFVKDIKIRYRQLKLVGGQLQIIVHEETTANAYSPLAPTTITNTGIVMDMIPFFCVTPLGLGVNPAKPPMLDIVDINLSHYRTSADLEHGRHFTGLPTPYVIGAESQTKMHIGSTSAWVIPDVNAKVGFLEFTGQGLQSLEKALAEKQSQLASLSSRLIDNSSRGSEAAETVKLRYLSETASLRSIVRSVEALLNMVYNTIAKMEGQGPVQISLNKDFLDERMSAALLKAWVEAYLSGGVTKEMLLNALKRGDALPPPGVEQGVIPDPPPVAPAKPASSPAPSTT
jgi:Domain of unknown function (DUF4055)